MSGRIYHLRKNPSPFGVFTRSTGDAPSLADLFRKSLRCATPPSPSGGGVDTAEQSGLVIAPYLTAPLPVFRFETSEGGGLFRLKMPPQRAQFSPGEQFDGTEAVEESKKRGVIVDFTAGSARRLRDLLMSLRIESWEGSHFVTLTYPAEFPEPDDHAIYKGHLDAISKRIARKWPALSSIWRLEFQSRGAAHYHLLTFGLPADFLTKFRCWLSRAWFEVVGSGDQKHLRAGVSVEKVEGDFKKTAFYIAAYASKKEQVRPGNFTGRYWGKFNSAGLPIAPLVTDALNRNQAIVANRIARKLLEKQVNARRVRIALDASPWGHLYSCLQADFLAPGKRSISHDLGGPCVIPAGYVSKGPMPGIRQASVQWWDYDKIPGFKRPAKFRARAGQSCSLYVDASAFRSQILRAVAGIADGPRLRVLRLWAAPYSPPGENPAPLPPPRALPVKPVSQPVFAGFERKRAAPSRCAMSFRINGDD